MTRSVALGIATVAFLGSPIGRIGPDVCGHHLTPSMVDLTWIVRSVKPRVVPDQVHKRIRIVLS